MTVRDIVNHVRGYEKLEIFNLNSVLLFRENASYLSWDKYNYLLDKKVISFGSDYGYNKNDFNSIETWIWIKVED